MVKSEFWSRVDGNAKEYAVQFAAKIITGLDSKELKIAQVIT